jgi:hypothetical protein
LEVERDKRPALASSSIHESREVERAPRETIEFRNDHGLRLAALDRFNRTGKTGPTGDRRPGEAGVLPERRPRRLRFSATRPGHLAVRECHIAHIV